jgi:hypothetical protein
MEKFCAKMVPKMLSAEQKELQEEICSELLQRTQNEPDFLKSEITCDETWIFMYGPETK